MGSWRGGIEWLALLQKQLKGRDYGYDDKGQVRVGGGGQGRGTAQQCGPHIWPSCLLPCPPPLPHLCSPILLLPHNNTIALSPPSPYLLPSHTKPLPSLPPPHTIPAGCGAQQCGPHLWPRRACTQLPTSYPRDPASVPHSRVWGRGGSIKAPGTAQHHKGERGCISSITLLLLSYINVSPKEIL